MFSRYSQTGLALLGLALYGGPLVAGMAGHALAVLPVFFALFLLYGAATRKPDLSTGAGRAGLAIIGVVQAGLVVASYGLGRGLAALTGPLIGPVILEQWPPLVLTAVAAGIGAWAFRDAAEMDVMLDSAIRALEQIDAVAGEASADGWPAAVPEAEAAVARAVTALGAIEAPREEEIDAIAARLAAEAGLAAFDPLYDTAGQETGNAPAVDHLLLRFAARPELRRALIARGEGGMAEMLLLNAPEAGVRAAARAGVLALVRAGAPVTQLPDPVWLAALAEAYPGEGFEAVHAARIAAA